MRTALLFFTTLLSLVVGCGTPGAPQPPSLHLPKPVDDFRAVRKGDIAHLSWTAPSLTSDEQGIRSIGRTRVCRGGCQNLVADRPFDPAKDAGKRESQDEDLSTLLHGGLASDFAIYTVEVTNASGRSAGSS